MGLGEPPRLFLTDALRKRYYYQLSLTLSACLAGDEAQQAAGMQAARAVLADGLSRDGADRAQVLLLDEQTQASAACVARIMRDAAP